MDGKTKGIDMSVKTKLSALARYSMGFIVGSYLMAWWSFSEMDLQMKHAHWDKEVQAITLFKHRAEFNELSTASEITELTDKYLIEQLLDFENPVINYCQEELLFSFLLPSCNYGG